MIMICYELHSFMENDAKKKLKVCQTVFWRGARLDTKLFNYLTTKSYSLLLFFIFYTNIDGRLSVFFFVLS